MIESQKPLEALCDDRKEVTVLGLGHISSGKTAFMIGLAYYLGLTQFGPLVSRIGSATHTAAAYRKGKMDAYGTAVTEIRRERDDLGFEGRPAGSHKIDKLRMYFQDQVSLRAINLYVQAGHTTTKKISQDKDFRVDGVLYFASQQLFNRFGENPSDFEGTLREGYDAVLKSLEQDKESVSRLSSQNVPLRQIVIRGYFDQQDGILVDERLLVTPAYDEILWEFGEIHRLKRREYMCRAFSIFDGFLRNELGLSGQLVSIAKREGTKHYKEIIHPHNG